MERRDGFLARSHMSQGMIETGPLVLRAVADSNQQAGRERHTEQLS